MRSLASTHRVLLAVVALLMTSLSGCGDDRGRGPRLDAAGTDSGSGTGDAGPRPDAAGRPDGGSVDVDAGTAGVDAGTPDVDGGTPGVDGGSTPVDAGPPGSDAGADAGPPGPDAGADAGACPGDTCTSPMTVIATDMPGWFTLTGDTSCGRDDFEVSCSRHFLPRPEVVYTMTVTRSQRISMRIEGADDEALEIRQTVCGGPALECDADIGAGHDAGIDRIYEPGTYYVVVDTYRPSTYTLVVGVDPDDDCAMLPPGAPLSPGIPYSLGTGGLAGATDDFSASCVGAGTADHVAPISISERGLYRVEGWGVFDGFFLMRAPCMTGPAGAAEVWCHTGPGVQDRILDPGEYIAVFEGSGDYMASAKRIWGRLILIGHDFTVRSTAADRLFTNALVASNGPADASRALEYVQYADLAAGGEVANARAAITEIFATYPWRSLTRTPLTDSAGLAAALADKDLFVIYEQELRPDAATLDAIGVAWAPTLTAFLDRGGTIVVLDSFAAETWRLVAPIGMFPSLGTGVDATGVRSSVVLAGPDILTSGVPAIYTAPNATTTFTSLGGTSVVQTSAGGFVVLSARRP